MQKLIVIRAVVCLLVYVYRGVSDSHHLIGYWAYWSLPNFCVSLGCYLFFPLCAHCVEGLASHADAVKIAVLVV